MIERTREDLETENHELRERVEALEAQVAHMLLAGYRRPSSPPAPSTTLRTMRHDPLQLVG